MRKLVLRAIYVFIFLFIVCHPISASANTYYYDGVGSIADANSWWDTSTFDGNNGTQPSSGDQGIIQSSISGTVGADFHLSYTLTVSGTLTIIGGSVFTVDTGGVLDVSAGTITVTSGTLRILSGTISLNNSSVINIQTSNSSLTVEGGALNISNTSIVYINGSYFSLQNAGTVSVSNGGLMDISNGSTYDVNSGSVNVNAGGFTVSNSILNISSGFNVQNNSTFTLNTSTTTLTQNTFSIDSSSVNLNNSFLYVNGGDLSLNSTNLTLSTSTLSLTTGTVVLTTSNTVLNNGSVINSNNTFYINAGSLTVNRASTLNIISGDFTNNVNSTLTIQCGGFLNLTGTLNNIGVFSYTYFNNSGTFNDAGTTEDISGTCPTIPNITSVTSSQSDGRYSSGTDISIQVVFNQSVTVTGVPQLTLETGSVDTIASYVSGSGTDTLTFVYTVVAGNSSSDLDYIGTSALSLHGGTIVGTTGALSANLTLPSPGATNSLSANKNIIIDTTAPTITSLATSTTATTATLTWLTSEAATSSLQYGQTTSYGTASSSGSSATTSHQYVLTGLTPATTYHIQLVVTDAAGNTGTSSDLVLVTASAPDATTTSTSTATTTQSNTTTGSSVSYGSSGGSGGGTSFISSITSTTSQPVLRPSVTASSSSLIAPLTPDNICTPYIRSLVPIKLGAQNNISNVQKLQTFLNTYEGTHLVVDGIYKQVDFIAVQAFQTKYKTQILSPWGLNEPTGYVYKTTLAKINALVCGSTLKCPVFTKNTDIQSVHSEVPRIKNFLNQILGTSLNTHTQTVDIVTIRAIRDFQTRYKDFILKPLNLPRATGLWYESTRKQANVFMGCM